MADFSTRTRAWRKSRDTKVNTTSRSRGTTTQTSTVGKSRSSIRRGELSVGHTMGASGGGGFWAVPARNDFGQVWSFASGAPPEMLFTQQQQQPATLFVRHQQQQQEASAVAAMGEASAARVGNYLPGHHLNLLASLSGGNTGSGRREEEDDSPAYIMMIILGEIIFKPTIITAGRSFTHSIKIRRKEHHKLVTEGVYVYKSEASEGFSHLVCGNAGDAREYLKEHYLKQFFFWETSLLPSRVSREF
ncbi:hypothetical protein IGI04_041760 [Brassica rapa subsp. trilocularis]|uniref:Protein-S-isoprenylcysteine O-methyltransferase n=1 Tax=Brassica rapa subsp. trilocularis TaxID=1813537 RepID=A0ABQ7KSF4_BRACM|nr:hypothetical protein IGI04_041760 [Brassica rapa subsp. trilocularis]